MTFDSRRTADPSSVPSAPPFTLRKPVTDVLHDVEIEDPYRWLEDQDHPETRAWIDAQNRHTDTVLGAWPGRADIAALRRLLPMQTFAEWARDQPWGAASEGARV